MNIERRVSCIIFAINTGSDNYASANEAFFHPSKAHFPKKVFTGMSYNRPMCEIVFINHFCHSSSHLAAVISIFKDKYLTGKLLLLCLFKDM